MPELTFQVINIIAYSKIILAVAVITFLLIIKYKNNPWLLSLVSSIFLVIFYVIFSWSFKKMFWGNNGDEIFIVSFFSQVLQGNMLKDFYYNNLPAFYPPLYFWLTGYLSRFFANNAITAAKIGVSFTLAFWFIGTFIWQKIYQVFINKKISTNLFAKKGILFFLFPLIYFFLIDFNDIILKPYETLTALILAILIGFIAESFLQEKWRIREYVFFGVSGAVLFLSYYFWWFIAIPGLFILILLSNRKWKNFLRVSLIGLIIVILSAPYIFPLFSSYLGGMENWQALFFIPNDFSTFVSFSLFSWRGLVLLAGLTGLIIYRHESFFKANLALVISAYLYQFLSIVIYIFGANPLQAAKPFLFLTTASLALGAAKLFFEIWRYYEKKLSKNNRFNIVLIILIFSIYFWPMTNFIDSQVVRQQLVSNQTFPPAFYLAENIKEKIKDYDTRTWLSSGLPEINAYLNIHYFIAHNPHFSHHASLYSKRMELINSLSQANKEEFIVLINDSPIDTLLLYKGSDPSYYPLFFWADNYPNGGRELMIKISKENIDSLNWNIIHEDREWLILTR